MAYVILRRPSGFRFFLLQNATWLATGLLLVVCANDIAELRWPDEPVVAHAVVTDAVSVTDRSVRCEVQLLSLSDSSGSVRPDDRRVMLSLPATDSAAALCPGDELCFLATLRSPSNRGYPYEFDYASYLRRQGITGVTSRVPSGNWSRSALSPVGLRRLTFYSRLHIRALQARDRLVEGYRRAGLPDKGLAVVAALTLGDRSRLTSGLRTVYGQAGASHLLALSGLHLGVLLVLLQWFLLRPLRHSRFYLPCVLSALLFIWSYTWLAGLPPSLVRSSVMYSLLLVTTILNRRSLTVNNLLFTMLLLLLFRSRYLFEVGFQLSCLAMAGLLLLAPRLERCCAAFPRWFRVPWRMFAVSLSAQLFTAPLVARYFHLFTPWSSFASLPAIPLTTLLVAVSPLLWFFGWLLPHVTWPARIVALLVDAQHAWLSWTASWPAAQWEVYPSWTMVVVLYVLLLFGLSVWAFGRIRRLTAMAASLFIVGMVLIYDRYIDREQPCLWFYNIPACPTVHVVYSPASSLLLTTCPDSVIHHTRYVDHSYWRRRLTRPPRTVDVGHCTTPQVHAHAGWVQLPGLSVWFLDDSPGRTDGIPASPDYLYVTRRYRGDLLCLGGSVHPGCVILDASLGARRARSYATTCRLMGWPCHDLASQGALKVAFK
ncbi:MAG: ComEC family competence protein [Clostridium sp.]|nr:ComEC family competence protein [Clostridium sp.]